MRKWEILAVFLAMALLAVASWSGIATAVESFTVSAVGSTDITDIGTGWAKSFKVIKVEFKTNASNGTMANQTIPAMKGKVVLGVTNPGAEAPDASYDLYILDEQGVDIFGGALNNRSTSASEQAMPKFGTDYFAPRPIYGPMTFSISGNTNTDANGELFMYFVE